MSKEFGFGRIDSTTENYSFGLSSYLLTSTLLYTEAMLSPSVLKNTGFDSLTTLY